MKVVIAGAGKYGSALGHSVQQKDDRSLIFLARNKETVREINEERTNQKICPEIVWKSNVTATTDSEEALKDCDVLFLCIPAQQMSGFINGIKPILECNTI